jgi:UDP-N-acetylglucosamine 3-dehydrogenase
MLNVAVIGLGTMGNVHVEAWSRISDVNVAAVSALDREKTEAVASRYGAKPYSQLEALLEQPDIDLVDICLPTYLHKQFVTKAAEAGKHIICEKPLGLDVKEARDMIDVCEQNGVELYAAQVVRFFPEYVNACVQVKKGKIGNPGIVRLSRGGPFPRAWENWYADEKKSGGLILDMMIHDFDWLRWTFGEVERVMARRVVRSEGTNPLEYVLVTLRTEDGVIAHVEGTWAHPSFRTSFEIAGDKGMIVHDSRDSAPLSLQLRAHEDKGVDPGVAVPESPLHKDPYQRQLEHFSRCLMTGARPIVTAHDALKAVEISQAALKSASSGKPVEIVKYEVN